MSSYEQIVAKSTSYTNSEELQRKLEQLRLERYQRETANMNRVIMEQRYRERYEYEQRKRKNNRLQDANENFWLGVEYAKDSMNRIEPELKIKVRKMFNKERMEMVGLVAGLIATATLPLTIHTIKYTVNEHRNNQRHIEHDYEDELVNEEHTMYQYETPDGMENISVDEYAGDFGGLKRGK